MLDDVERFLAKLSGLVSPDDQAPEETIAEGMRLLADFVQHYAPGTCKRCDPIYWQAVRWDLRRKGRGSGFSGLPSISGSCEVPDAGDTLNSPNR